ncbi:MAG: HyaD/HybD family hydrogenase maturation endopeptidase [Hyphomicrobiales bacterium]|nr:HyaD/HybD family hydrogenase maturation endopeptidase [Hyphomicrobiales bacterium]
MGPGGKACVDHRQAKVLVLGVGNILFGDDGIGPAAVSKLEAEGTHAACADFIDGGTIALSLLPEIEDRDALIIVDAARLEDPPGTVRIFEGGEMDERLTGSRRSVHDVAVSDVITAAQLAGTLPDRRALVCIAPETIGLGYGLSPAVAAALPDTCRAIGELIERWSS